MIRLLAAISIAWTCQKPDAPKRVEPEELQAGLLGQLIVVEAQFESKLGKAQGDWVKLKDCKMPFLVPNNPAERFRSGDNVEAIGTVVNLQDPLGGGLVVGVKVRTMKLAVDDEVRYRERAGALSDVDFAGWYDLSAWTKRRYQRTNKPELIVLERSAYENGVRAERKIHAANPEQLRKLLERVQADGKWPMFDAEALEHEILHARWKIVDRDSMKAVQSLATQVRMKLLPKDATVPPLENFSVKRYDADPHLTFVNADAVLRKRLARYFEATLLNRAMQLEFAAGKKDAGALAAMAEKANVDLRDYPHFGLAWANRLLDPIEQQMDTIGEREAQRGANVIAQLLGDPDKANQIRRKWIVTQQERLATLERKAAERARTAGAAPPPQDAHGRFEVARVWMEWFPKDADANRRAGKLLLEAIQIDPKLDAADSRLRELGYRRSGDGSWSEPSADRAMRSIANVGIRIKVGDTGDKVRDSLGTPSQAARVVGKDWIMHYWQYDLATVVLREDPRSGVPRVSAIQGK